MKIIREDLSNQEFISAINAILFQANLIKDFEDHRLYYALMDILAYRSYNYKNDKLENSTQKAIGEVVEYICSILDEARNSDVKFTTQIIYKDICQLWEARKM